MSSRTMRCVGSVLRSDSCVLWKREKLQEGLGASSDRQEAYKQYQDALDYFMMVRLRCALPISHS